MRALGEGDEALGGHETIVLKANAELTGQVHARLDRDDGTLPHRIVRAPEIGELMDVDAHAVAKTMTVVLAVTGIADNLPRKLMAPSSCVRCTRS